MSRAVPALLSLAACASTPAPLHPGDAARYLEMAIVALGYSW
ncbi:MAG TPA: hypothetical protein QF764_16305 [Planctomycetota bacterium]|nr:hypothetical protein [Planctomycetota bacterium]